MRNKLTDLNNHLFAQLEKLNDDDLKGNDLQLEIDRAKAMSHISSQIIDVSKTTLEAVKLASCKDMDLIQLPETFAFKKNESL